MLTEGVDVPTVEAVFLTRPTGSLALFSQMVGRALRGPEFGGTATAHIVDFHDLWGEFPDWRVRWSDVQIDVPPADAPKGAGGGEVVPFPLEEAIRAAELHQRYSVGAIERHVTAIPLGVYSFQVDSTDSAAEPVTVDHSIMVFEHNRPGFERIEARITADRAALVRASDWGLSFFADLPHPAPPSAALRALRTYALTSGQMPPFQGFAERDEVDPERVGAQLAREALSVVELQERIDAVIAEHLALVQRVWGAPGLYAEQVTREVMRIVRNEPQRADERIPRITLPSREEWTPAQGVHDLAAIVDDILDDEALLPGGLTRPEVIEWGQDGRGSWGLYLAGPPSRIVINPLLDHPMVPHEIVEFVVYHELLHHEQAVQGMTIGHGPEFRIRENKHSHVVDANAFLDTFEERFSEPAL